MIVPAENHLKHYGILRKSGRYPWGSGDDVTQRSRDMLNEVEKLKAQGLDDVAIAKGLGFESTTELRQAKSIARHEKIAAETAEIVRLKNKSMSNVEIGKQIGMPEPTVRSRLAAFEKDKQNVLVNTMNMLRSQVAEKEFVDVGKGNEVDLAISSNKLKTAVSALKSEGYKVSYVKVRQVSTGKETTVTVLSAPDSDTYRIYKDNTLIKYIGTFSPDGGRSYFVMKPPLNVDSKRIAVRYGPEGGKDTDGVIYVRPGVKDLSLGHGNYAQVRIAVDGTHYLKGMAMYKDNLPPGTDLVFNTVKTSTGNKHDAFKKMERDLDGNIDPKNPFGSSIKRQIMELDKDGNEVVTSAMNIVHGHGDWDNWSKSLSSQILSKQHPALAKTQLDMTYDMRKQELADIKKLTNPEVRKKMLQDYADNVDKAAVHLKAAHLPRQSSHAILPIESMKDTEVYAPNFRNGERVVLIRHPHGGIFEIPELIVNNRQKEAKKLIGQAEDAIGINSRVAEKLSGADFDGDAVIVIPNSRGKIKTAPTLEKLKGFDPKAQYPKYEGMKVLEGDAKQHEMGKISNLITDMTIKGAPPDEIVRAVRHSMVVIDAEKHELNYRQSYLDNGIQQLKTRYQKEEGQKGAGGAATLISRAKSEARVPDRVPRKASLGGPINKVTGEKEWEVTGKTYVNKKGETVPLTVKSTKLAEAKDAFSLVSSPSGTPIETVYATHSNRLKALANEARLEITKTKSMPTSSTAKAVYSKEVASLTAKLNVAEKNAPLERQAQIIANSTISAKRRANPGMDDDQLKTVRNQALAEARDRTGASSKDIRITPQEWEAIQSGAIAPSKLNRILTKANQEDVKKLATPRESLLMNSTKTRRAKAMYASGYTQAEIAEAIGVSVSTLKASMKEEG